MAWHSGKPADGDLLSASAQYIRENFAELEPLQPLVAELVDLTALQPHITELTDLTALQPHITELTDLTALHPYIDALLSSRIVEMGSNSNGWYVRWENGWQICFGGQKTAEYVNTYTYRLLWTYPAAFVSAPSAVGTRSSDGTAKSGRLVGPSIRSISGATVNYYIDDPNGGFADGETWNIYPIAIGRWK